MRGDHRAVGRRSFFNSTLNEIDKGQVAQGDAILWFGFKCGQIKIRGTVHLTPAVVDPPQIHKSGYIASIEG